MASKPYNATGTYQPDKTIGLPLLYAWPPRPFGALRYLFYDLLFPWAYFFYRSRVCHLVLPDANACDYGRIGARLDRAVVVA